MIYLMIVALILMMVDDGIIGIQFGQDIKLLGLCLHCRTGVVVRRADLPRSSLHYLCSARR